MGQAIVSLDGEFGLDEAREWESRAFRRVCQAGQEEAVAYLERLDEALMRQRPRGGGVRFSSAKDGDPFGGGVSPAADVPGQRWRVSFSTG